MTASITVGGSKLNSNGKERKSIITSYTHTHTHTVVKSPSTHLDKGRTDDQSQQISSQVAVTFIQVMLSSLSVVLL